MKLNHESKIERMCDNPKNGRAQLMGAYLDLSEKDKPVLVATSGKHLAYVPVEVDENDTPGFVTVEAIKESRKKSNMDCIMLNGSQKLMSCEMPRPDLGTFPNWRMVTKRPDGDPVLKVMLNAELLDDLQSGIGNGEILLEFYGQTKNGSYESAIFVKGEYGEGVLMPRRNG